MARAITALLGIWLMAAPGVFNLSKTISDNDRIVGPVAATFAIIAIWECTRNVRWLNLPLGVWLLLAPWILNYGNSVATVNDMATGALIIALCFVKPKREQRFGGGWAMLFKSDSTR